MYRRVTNALLILIAFVIAAKSNLIPSGIPTVLLESAFDAGLGDSSPASKADSRETILPVSTIYTRLQSLVKPVSLNKPKIAIVVVLESLGFSADKRVNGLIKENLDLLVFKLVGRHPRIHVDTSGIDYQIGGTLGAELRYLCDFREEKSLTAFRLSVNQEYLRKECIPNTLRKKGFETHYIHNGTPSFYRRNTIMPLIGFSEMHFQDTSSRTLVNCLSKPFCGDDRLAYSEAKSILQTYINSAFSGPKKGLFIHLMTIDTHAPYTSDKSAFLSYKDKLEQASLELFDFLEWLLAKDLSEHDLEILITADHPPGSITRAPTNNTKNPQNGSNAVYSVKSTSLASDS